MIRALSVASRVAARQCQKPIARNIGSQSWAYDRLVELGKVPLVPMEDRPLILITQEILDAPSQKVQDLADEVLKMGLLDVTAVFSYLEEVMLAVRYIAFPWLTLLFSFPLSLFLSFAVFIGSVGN
jgi:hypothetical protein